MMAATSVITERSPYIVRTSFSVPQTTVPLANWAAANGIKKVMTVVSDYAPDRCGDGKQFDGGRHNQVGDAALGLITSHHYSAAYDSPENKSFVADFKKANGGMRPNLMAMQSYDGMHLIYEALKKTNG